MANLGDFLKTINNKTYRVDDLEIEADYPPYIINRSMSYFIDAIMSANDINRYPDAPKKQQYDFYFYGLRKRNRFSPWTKPDKETKRIELIKEYYGYSTKRAEEVVDIIPDSEMIKIAKKMYKGGRE